MSQLTNVEGRVICRVDIESKNSHRFADGTTIRLERDWENFNKRETQPTNAIVVAANNIPVGAEILIHHNSIHDVNRIFDYHNLSGEVESSSIRYYSIVEAECFAWRIGDGELQPMKGFQFALRVFKPYKGVLQGVEHTLIKNVLYLTTGKLKGQVAHCLIASDYEMVFQGIEGREDRVIRVRHSDDEELDREELTAINHSLTEQVKNGELYVGLTPTTAKPINTTNEKTTHNTTSTISG